MSGRLFFSACVIGFAAAPAAHFDRDLPVKTLENVEQLVGQEAPEVPIA